ncbi:MAG: NAD(P)-binding protein, partial [Methylococcaceae bacterium]|nr:NAD(P)-binding protein [Methylococcaceae bacterium]
QESIAIIGAGASGMTCGNFLHSGYELTIYEQNDYVGGHANTAVITADEEIVHADTAFVIFNDENYPLFNRMLKELGVDSIQCPMDFSIHVVPAGWEYNTRGLSYIPTNLKNLFDARFRALLRETGRFYKQAIEIINEPRYHTYSIADYVREKGYSSNFLDHYLIPILAVVWSIPPRKMLEYPALTMIEFLKNHGAFQGLFGTKRWRTVARGSGTYRDKLIAPFKDRIRIQCAAVKVKRNGSRIEIQDSRGETLGYDKVIFACHADQALRCLSDPDPLEAQILGAFRYTRSKVQLHTDASILPRNRRLWAGWNYYVDYTSDGELLSSFSYYMNKLQRVSKRQNYFVTVNPWGRIDERKILREYDYEHPLFDVAAIQAQQQLAKLNENGRTYYCGSYFGYGFHEDAFRAAIEVCRTITGEPIWESD